MKRTPMRRVAMSPRRTPLKRGNSRLGLWSPSRLRVTPEERRARDLVRSRSGGLCEVCGEQPATEWHHRKNRSQGGGWSAANGLNVCRDDHRWITEHPAGARAKGWSVPSWADPALLLVIYRGSLARLVDDGSVDFPDFPIGGAR